jgi:hypothetical protein
MRQLRLQVANRCLCVDQLSLGLIPRSRQRANRLACSLELIVAGAFMMYDLDLHFTVANEAAVRPSRPVRVLRRARGWRRL